MLRGEHFTQSDNKRSNAEATTQMQEDSAVARSTVYISGMLQSLAVSKQAEMSVGKLLSLSSAGHGYTRLQYCSAGRQLFLTERRHKAPPGPDGKAVF